MDETLQTPQAETQVPGLSQGEQAVKEGDANKASTSDAVAQTREDLSHVAVRPVVTATGEVLTPNDVKNEMRYRLEHGGRPSDETSTKI